MQALFTLLLLSILAFITIDDIRHLRILHAVSLPAIVFAVIGNLALGMPPASLAAGMAAGGGFFLAQYLASRGRAVGFGDVTLGVLMGACLGFPMVLVAIALAYIVGGLVALGLLATGRARRGSHLPLGAFLAPATGAMLVWGEQMLSWYWGLV